MVYLLLVLLRRFFLLIRSTSLSLTLAGPFRLCEELWLLPEFWCVVIEAEVRKGSEDCNTGRTLLTGRSWLEEDKWSRVWAARVRVQYIVLDQVEVGGWPMFAFVSA